MKNLEKAAPLRGKIMDKNQLACLEYLKSAQAVITEMREALEDAEQVADPEAPLFFLELYEEAQAKLVKALYAGLRPVLKQSD